jgi:hypothetical protein
MPLLRRAQGTLRCPSMQLTNPAMARTREAYSTDSPAAERPVVAHVLRVEVADPDVVQVDQRLAPLRQSLEYWRSQITISIWSAVERSNVPPPPTGPRGRAGPAPSGGPPRPPGQPGRPTDRTLRRPARSDRRTPRVTPQAVQPRDHKSTPTEAIRPDILRRDCYRECAGMLACAAWLRLLVGHQTLECLPHFPSRKLS